MSNKDCDHNISTLQKHQTKLHGEVFHYEAETCSDCSAVLWSHECNKEYLKWVDELHKSGHPMFNIVFNLSVKESQKLTEVLITFSNIKNDLIFIDFLFDLIRFFDKGENNLLHEVEESEESEKIPTTIRLRPNQLLEIDATSSLFSLDVEEIIEMTLKQLIISRNHITTFEKLKNLVKSK